MEIIGWIVTILFAHTVFGLLFATLWRAVWDPTLFQQSDVEDISFAAGKTALAVAAANSLPYIALWYGCVEFLKWTIKRFGKPTPAAEKDEQDGAPHS